MRIISTKKINWHFIVLFLVLLPFFSWLQWDYSFVDPDTWYHARLSALIWQQGWFIDFVWLPFTQLGHIYTDHHFLYHLIIAPFTQWLQPWLAIKVVTVIISSLAIAIFAWFLHSQNTKNVWLYIWLLIASQPFLFRFSLGKTLPLVLILIFLALYFYWQKYNIRLFFVSWLMVLTYAGWPLFFLLLGSFWIGENFNKYFKIKKISKNLKKLFKNSTTKSFGASIIGILIGIFTHPYFPANLKFYFEQVWQIGLVNMQEIIKVGGEWYPYQPQLLIANLGLIIFFVIIALTFIVWESKKLSLTSKWFSVWVVVFLILTLKSQRYVEYFVPFVICWLAFVNRDLKIFNRIISGFIKYKNKSTFSKFGSYVLLFYFVFSFLWLTVRDIDITNKQLKNGQLINSYQAAASFLNNQANNGEVVFHSDWDEFPGLWYWNQSNRYIAGLDPTFFYKQDRKRYYQWVNITTGDLSTDLTDIITEQFNARWVFIDQGHDTMKMNLINTNNWEIVFNEAGQSILKLR